MSPTSTLPNTLLVHDGELADLRALFGELGAPFVERRERVLAEDREASWGLVIATPRRLLALHLNPSPNPPVQIAITDQDSRTLRNSLRRAGIRLMVRRPVHPAALRALVLHSLYRGPEKRRNARVSVGAPIRIRVGWRQRPAILADLSIGGCRLLTHQDLERGKGITVLLPAELTGSKGFSIRARVLRTSPSKRETGQTVIARFEKISKRLHECLKSTIELHAAGPALFNEGPNGFDDETIAVTGKIDAIDSVEEPGAVAVPPAEPQTGNSVDDPDDGERRGGPRRPIDTRVIALGQEATRLLMGRDISVGGMRVNPNPLLRLGEDFQLAIHVIGSDTPLVVKAKVHRDDGERGIMLRFHELSTETKRSLNAMVDTMPLLEPGGEEGDTGLVVSEILSNDDAPQVTA